VRVVQIEPGERVGTVDPLLHDADAARETKDVPEGLLINGRAVELSERTLADQLEERGLATRTAGTDRRIKLIALTPAGVEKRAEIAAAVNTGARFARQLNADQRETLRSLLDLLEQS